MLTRYDLVHDINCDPDCAMMWKNDTGVYVKYEDAKGKIGFLVDALVNLKSCDIELNSASELNEYVDTILRGYR